MEETRTKTSEELVKKSRELRLFHPKALPIPILNEERNCIIKEVPSRFKIDKVLEKSIPFSKICFNNGTQGWVKTDYIREV